MGIPINSFTNIVDALVGVGNGTIPANRVREIKKAIPIDMTDIEKRFDPQTNNIIFNKILICRQIEALINEIIADRNFKFFAKQELEKRLLEREFDAYLRSRMEFDELSQDAQGKLLAMSRDELLRPHLEKIIALEKLIQELEAQNEILMAQYDEYVHDFGKKVSVKLEKIEPYAKLPEKERVNLVEKAFSAAIDIEVEAAKKRAAKEEHKRARDSAALHPPLAEESQPPVIFSDRDEIKKKTAVRDMFITTTKQVFSISNILHTLQDLNDIADVLSEEFEREKQPVIAIVMRISDNGVLIEKAHVEVDNTRKEVDNIRKEVNNTRKEVYNIRKEVDNTLKQAVKKSAKLNERRQERNDNLDIFNAILPSNANSENVLQKKGPQNKGQ